MCPRAVPISLYERALLATDLSYEGRRLADTELLTPPTTHDESMGHLYRPHSVSSTSPLDVGTEARRAPHGMCKCY